MSIVSITSTLPDDAVHESSVVQDGVVEVPATAAATFPEAPALSEAATTAATTTAETAEAADTRSPLASLRAAARIMAHGGLRAIASGNAGAPGNAGASRRNRATAAPPPTGPAAGSTANPTASNADNAAIEVTADGVTGVTG
jgi:hypothetical protein